MLTRLSEKRLRHLALEGSSFSAYEALSLGGIDSVVPESEAWAVAIGFIHKVSMWPERTLGPIKKMDISAEVKTFEEVWFNEDHKKILKDFLKFRKVESTLK